MLQTITQSQRPSATSPARTSASAAAATADLALHVVSGVFYGGGQQVAIDLVAALGPAVAALCIAGDKSPRMRDAADHRVSFDGRYNRLPSLVASARQLRRLIRELRPAVVHTHGWDVSVIAALALLGSPVPQLVHWHTTDEWLTSRRVTQKVRRTITRLLLRGPRKRIVAVSDASRRHLVSCMGWPLDSVGVLHNGIDVQRFSPSARPERSGALTIGVAARLAPLKGLEYLIDALAQVAPSEPTPVTLRIAGEGSHSASLERHAQERGVAERVEFLGRLDDTAAFYRSLDIFVLPSLTEGLPLCVLEAMASGCATVSTNVGGVPEIITDGVDGLLVPAKDAAAIAQALRRLMSDAAARAEIAAAGRRRVVSHFTLAQASGRLRDIYASMTGARSGTP